MINNFVYAGLNYDFLLTKLNAADGTIIKTVLINDPSSSYPKMDSIYLLLGGFN